MNRATDVLPMEEASEVWQRLSTEVGRFVDRWESGGDPPSLVEQVANLPEALRRLTAIELIKIDLEYRWLRRKQPRYVEEYLQDLPLLAADPPVDLLYEEFHVRRQSGETAQPNDLFRRFPGQADELRRLLGAGMALKTTTLVHREPRQAVRLQPGETIDDFQLLTPLGEGAFGAVYLALQRSMQRMVALKVTADRGAEPQTLAQLDHEHIVRVYDQRRLSERGLRLMYMQFAAGGTLQAVIEKLRNLPPHDRRGADFVEAVQGVLRARGEEPPNDSPLRERLRGMTWPEVVCWIGARLARALDYAHAVGVLHRDVKPANVLLTAEGSPKLADFNISFSSKLDGATPTAYFGGSLAYMSPEQLEACSPAHDRTPDSLDGRTDLYSLGVVLWELLSGRRPFEDESIDRSWAVTLEQMILRRSAGATPQMLASLRLRGVPGLERILTRILAPRAEDRYATGDELARDLEICLHPETCRLLFPPPGGWRGRVQRFPTATIVALTVAPNAVGGVINYLYNHGEIIPRLQGAETIFQFVQTAINVTLFPLGMLVGVLRCRSFAKYASNPAARRALSDVELAGLRRRAYFIGHEAAMIGLTLWVFAGILYPTAMHVGLGAVPVETYAHFFSSLLLCGLIAAAYPFLFVTYVVLHALLPPFVRLATMDRSDRRRLELIRKRSWTYLALAAMVPMTAVAMLTLAHSAAQWALAGAIALGIGGFAGAGAIVRRLQSDIDALQVTTAGASVRPTLNLPSRGGRDAF